MSFLMTHYDLRLPSQILNTRTRHLQRWIVVDFEFCGPRVGVEMRLRVCLDVANDFDGSLIGDVIIPLAFLRCYWVVLLLRRLRDPRRERLRNLLIVYNGLLLDWRCVLLQGIGCRLCLVGVELFM